MKKLILPALTAFLLFTGCGLLQEENDKGQTGEDNFYTTTKGWDLFRIPLIKPYELITATENSNSWIYNFWHGDLKRKKSIEVTSYGISDSVITIYSESTSMPGEMTEAWLMIDVKAKKEQIFTSKNDYLNALTERKVREPEMYNPDSAYAVFKSTGELLHMNQ